MVINKAVLLIAHGSREDQANQEVRDLAARIEKFLGQEAQVLACFLEIEPPGIQEAFAKAVEAGAESVVACPYFLSSGVHVRKDIPVILQECLKEFPKVTAWVTPALGPDPRFDRIIMDRLSKEGMEQVSASRSTSK